MSSSSREARRLVASTVARSGRVARPANRFRRFAFFLVVTATAAVGVLMMGDILRANGITVLEASILLLFAVTFSWITISFWSGVIGFFLMLFRLEPISLRGIARSGHSDDAILTRTAVIMPVFNEDPARVIAGMEATIDSLQSVGEAGHFDFYLLSDTTDDAIAASEVRVWADLRTRLGDSVRLFYRRRTDNEGRKAGNVADFCRRWGGYYEYMVVIDADSVMTAGSLLNLVRAMQANPAAGLIQTVPIPARQETFFGRFLQFAATLNSPMLATGLSFWQTESANYWGHNAIIRIRAFLDYCGLPKLAGTPPLGGDILSHDFVEAALLRRGGWHCYLLPYIEGSYEEVPGNMLDFVKRDRRWVQGNLQHMKLLFCRGLNPLSRLHFLMGATAFVSSLLWLLMLVMSTVDAIYRAMGRNHFFNNPQQLFPDWPIAKTGMITSLLSITIVILVLPKVLALILGLCQRRREFGGTVALLASSVVELLFSVLIAPIMMTFHAFFVVSVLLGRKVSWNTQTREGRLVPWREAFFRTAVGSVVAIGWGVSTWIYAPVFFWWLSPILIGLILGAPIVRFSSSLGLGRACRRAGIFLTPSEVAPPLCLRTVDWRLETDPVNDATQKPTTPMLLPERPQTMPTQPLSRRRPYLPPLPS